MLKLAPEIKRKHLKVTDDLFRLGKVPLGYLVTNMNETICTRHYKIVECNAREVEAHNRALSRLELKLISNSRIGQKGTAYLQGTSVRTFYGDQIAFGERQIFRPSPRIIEFKSGGKRFRGRLIPKQARFEFKRIA